MIKLNHFTNIENKYCKLSNLQNESDVEQFFIIGMLKDLGYSSDYIKTKSTIKITSIGKGRKKKTYKPDYICYVDKGHKKPVLIIDAKHPDVSPDEGLEDALLYASILRRKLDEPKPEQMCIGTNGLQTIIKHYDSDEIVLEISFKDFIDENKKFKRFQSILKRTTLQKRKKTDIQTFRYERPEIGSIRNIFEACHKLIWKTEKRSPSSAFWEFAKIMFIKLTEDKKLKENKELARMIENNEPLPRDKVIFSTYWIEREKKTDPNPINTILFKNLRKKLERQIKSGEKKRIFEDDEEIDLEPLTIKEVVKLIQHYNLLAIDEDLNGRLFETFLTATMRGKELGQFFTPRTVVKFMIQMADLKATKDHIDIVMDGCCGTGGFLIEAMADLSNKIEINNSLTNVEKGILIEILRREHLWGIDAGKDPPVARIARLNMFLHKDGGSRIYFSDFLDKYLEIKEGLEPEIEEERIELKKTMDEPFVNVMLTNPPFAMKYERKKKHEFRILKQYQLLDYQNKNKQRTSLKSMVMFIERYCDILNPGDKLLTIIDESIINTKSNQSFREYIMENFIIKTVISLPRNTFVKAQSASKTSVLYLTKKKSLDEKQSAVFMAISENVGHTDTGKERPQLSDLNNVLEAYRYFEKNGKLPKIKEARIFIVNNLENRTKRIDAHYFDPRYFETLKKLDKISKKTNWNIVSLEKILNPHSKKNITGGATPYGAIYVSDGIKFIRVNNVHPDGFNLEKVVYIDDETHNNLLKRSQLKPKDVVLTITGTYGIACAVPIDFDEANINQHCVRIEVDTSQVEPEYLAIFLNSNLCKVQMDRAVTGSSRPALDYSAIRNLKILLPPSPFQIKISKDIDSIYDDANVHNKKANQLTVKGQNRLEKTLDEL